jgi:hypothetical protein
MRIGPSSTCNVFAGQHLQTRFRRDGQRGAPAPGPNGAATHARADGAPHVPSLFFLMTIPSPSDTEKTKPSSEALMMRPSSVSRQTRGFWSHCQQGLGRRAGGSFPSTPSSELRYTVSQEDPVAVAPLCGSGISSAEAALNKKKRAPAGS